MQHSRDRRAEAQARAEAAPRRGRPALLAYGHWWWALPGILLVLAIHYVATSVGGFFAFTDWSGIGRFECVGLENFDQIFQDPTKSARSGNTLFLAFGSVILTNVFGLLSPSRSTAA